MTKLRCPYCGERLEVEDAPIVVESTMRVFRKTGRAAMLQPGKDCRCESCDCEFRWQPKTGLEQLTTARPDLAIELANAESVKSQECAE